MLIMDPEYIDEFIDILRKESHSSKVSFCMLFSFHIESKSNRSSLSLSMNKTKYNGYVAVGHHYKAISNVLDCTQWTVR